MGLSPRFKKALGPQCLLSRWVQVEMLEYQTYMEAEAATAKNLRITKQGNLDFSGAAKDKDVGLAPLRRFVKAYSSKLITDYEADGVRVNDGKDEKGEKMPDESMQIVGVDVPPPKEDFIWIDNWSDWAGDKAIDKILTTKDIETLNAIYSRVHKYDPYSVNAAFEGPDFFVER